MVLLYVDDMIITSMIFSSFQSLKSISHNISRWQSLALSIISWVLEVSLNNGSYCPTETKYAFDLLCMHDYDSDIVSTPSETLE